MNTDEAGVTHDSVMSRQPIVLMLRLNAGSTVCISLVTSRRLPFIYDLNACMLPD